MKKTLLSLIALLTVFLTAFAQGTELWNPSAVSIDHTFFATTAGWVEDNESSATYDAGVLTVNIATDKVAQWQGQVFLNHGMAFQPSKQYDVSFKIHADKAVNGITFKVDNNTGIVFEDQSINVNAGETFTYAKVNVNGAVGDGQIVFDFGHATAGTTITVSDFSFLEHDPAPIVFDPTKPCDASSGNPSLAVDNNAKTRWESTTNDNQWWAVNYGEPKEFNTIQILWEGAYGKSFKLQGSNDGINWDELTTITDQTIGGPFPYLQTINLESTVSYQYVMFVGIARGTQYGYSFWEFKTFVGGNPILTTLTVTPEKEFAKVGTSVPLNVKALDQFDVSMDVAVDYTITPAGAATIADNVLTANQAGIINVTASVGEVTSAFNILSYAGENLSLSTNIDDDNKVIAQSEFAPDGTDAFHAVDANEGSVYQGSATNGTSADEASRTFDSWFVLDLGQEVNVELITIKFEGACSQEYHIDFASAYADDATEWTTGYSYVGSEGINGRTDAIYPGGAKNLENGNGVRYVRFFSTKAATQWGMKIFDMKVIGTPVNNGIDVNVDANVGYATMYYDKELTTTDDVTVYTGVISDDKLMLTDIGGKTIPANTAVLVDGSCRFTETSTGVTFTGANDLRGVAVDTDVTTLGADGILVLGYVDNTAGFYTYTGTTLEAHKAYIPKTADMAAKALTIIVEKDETDGINTIEDVRRDAEIYNLNGVRMNKAGLQKGVYIMNGKKYVVK